MQSRLGLQHRVTLAVALAATSATSVYGQGLQGRATGLTGVYAEYDFNGLALFTGTGDAITNQLSASGLLFAGAYYGPVTPLYGPSFASAALYNYSGQDASTEIVVTFSQAVSAVAFNFATVPGVSSFKVYRNNGLVGGTTTSAPAYSETDRAKWWGFEFFDGTVFDKLVISNAQYADQPMAFGIDNLQVGTATVVPEPSTVVLLAAGLGVLFVGMRRRHRA